MKKIGRNDIIGQRGISHIQDIVLSMGFMFYQTGGVETGIDGYIELRDAETGEVGNLVLQVQGKATERERLQGDTGETFEFTCTDAEIGYWTQGTAPVLLIFVSLRDKKAYWKSLKEWFSDPERVKSRKVVFRKVEDEFTRASKDTLISIASAVKPGASGPNVRRHEELLANLVGVTFAPRLYWAPTEHATDKAFGTELREIKKDAGSEWIVRSKSVLSFHPLDEWPWNKLCDFGAMEEFDVEEWSDSDDEDRQRDFVALLNRALGEFVRPALYNDRDSGVLYFRKPGDRDILNFAYRSLQNTTTRRVVGNYGRSKKDPTNPSYWRHSGFMHRFVRLAEKWFIEVTPTYHFTYNGQDPDAFAGERLKKIKEIENNAAVMGQFVMWRDFLITYRIGDLLTERYPFLSFAATEPLELDVGVPDDLWKSQEADPSSPLFEFALSGETVEDAQ
ncbi:DUF4365 domain-containing protein [Bradyrhizobium sp. BRP20]|uniref:DUF4365 domain-containing protein n=1 Tax=unclassified Bradyrhizobium TaxID=2631580 RepID=UPI001CD2123E|nr:MULTISPECIES: DUF4365 domain-containing protein [unclassified Bradyrhizobium]MCA1438008.1 DUF4365 domain-containing protein [Bradyrhizobium sp. BRP20]MCA1552117.1 DUF4365 domain-containing protein [Bradyrhizobium sp. BRP19]